MIAPRVALVTSLLLGLSGTALAQTTSDRAYVGVTVARATKIGSQGTKLDDREQLELRAPLPPIRAGRMVILPSLGYETRWLAVDDQAPPVDAMAPDLDRTFHRFQLALTSFRPLSSRWLAIAGVSAVARTDLDTGFDVALDTSWSLFAMASYQIERLPGASVTMGAVALYPVDTSPVFPLASFSYRQGPYTVEIGMPRTSLFAAVHDGIEIGITGAFDRQAFRTDLLDADTPPEARYVRETALRFGPAVNANLAGDLWVCASVGLDVLNDFALLDDDRDEVALAREPTTRPAPYARLLLTWRPPRRAR